MKVRIGRDRPDGSFEPLGTVEDVGNEIHVEMLPAAGRTSREVHHLIERWRPKGIDYQHDQVEERTGRELVEELPKRMIGPGWRAVEVHDDDESK